MRWHFPYAVEAVVFFCCACQNTFTTVQYQFIYQVVSEDLNFTKNHSVEYCTPNTTNNENEDAVADEVSRWTLYSMMTGYITGVIGSTVFVSWSDSIDRKISIAFPVIGTFLAAAMQCIVIAYRLPLYTLMITQVVYGLSGSVAGLLGIGCAYLSDMVKLEDRGKRFNILEISSGLGAGILQISTGYWITSTGFVPTSILVTGCGFISLLFIPFIKSKTDHDSRPWTNPSKEISETSPLLHDEAYDVKFSTARKSYGSDDSHRNSLGTQLMTSWSLYTTRRCVCEECLEDLHSDGRHVGKNIRRDRAWRLWFYAVAHAIYVFAMHGVGFFTTMFVLSYPICFTPVLVGAQSGISNGLSIFGPLSLLLLQGYLKFQGQTIILIAIAGRICYCVLTSVAKGPALVFAGVSFAVFYILTSPLSRSEASRLVSSMEQGAALAVMSGMQNVACVFSPLVFLTLYPATLHIFHGFSYLVAAMFFAVAFLMMTIVWIANRRKE